MKNEERIKKKLIEVCQSFGYPHIKEWKDVEGDSFIKEFLGSVIRSNYQSPTKEELLSLLEDDK